MLFDPRSNMDLLLACLGLVVALSAISSAALSGLAETHPGVALLLAVLTVAPPLVNLLRYRRAPAGCAVVPAGFVLYGLGRLAQLPGWSTLLLLAAPNVGLLALDLLARPLQRWLTERRGLRDVAAGTRAADFTSALAHPSPKVRAAGADALAAYGAEALPILSRALREGGPDERRAALRGMVGVGEREGGSQADAVREILRAAVRDRSTDVAADVAATTDVAAGAAAALPLLDPDLQHTPELARAEERPEVQLAFAGGLVHAGLAPGPGDDLAAALLVTLLAAPALEGELRARALETLDLALAPERSLVRADLRAASPEPPSSETPAPETPTSESLRTAAIAVARPLLTCDEVTPELLWLLTDHAPTDLAPAAAAHARSETFDVANAAVEATWGIALRSDLDLGPATAPTRAALEQARDQLRAVHPREDNMLADRLVARIEELLTALDEGASG